MRRGAYIMAKTLRQCIATQEGTRERLRQRPKKGAPHVQPTGNP